MNKTFFLTIMVAIIAILSTSCTNYRSAGPGVTQTVTADTVITNLMPVLADRFDCNNNLLPDPKVEDWMVNHQYIRQTTECGLSDKELNGLNYFYKEPHDSVMNPNFWERRSFWELFLIVMLASLLLGLLLRRIINGPANPGSTHPAHPASPPTPPAAPPAPVKNQANLLTGNDMSGVLEALKNNGGNFSTSQDGSFSLTLNRPKDNKVTEKTAEVAEQKP